MTSTCRILGDLRPERFPPIPPQRPWTWLRRPSRRPSQGDHVVDVLAAAGDGLELRGGIDPWNDVLLR
jgi:hypothetical protein